MIEGKSPLSSGELEKETLEGRKLKLIYGCEASSPSGEFGDRMSFSPPATLLDSLAVSSVR